MKDDEAFELTYRDTKKKTDFRVNERDTQTRHNNKKTRLAWGSPVKSKRWSLSNVSFISSYPTLESHKE